MKNKNIQNLLQEIVEEEIPAESVDLWTKIKKGMEMNAKPKSNNQSSMSLIYRAAVFLLVGVIVFFLTPQGQSLAQEYLLQYFKRAESNSRPIPSEVFVTATAIAEQKATAVAMVTDHPEIPTPTATMTSTPWPGTRDAETYTVSEIEEWLGFDVLEPGWLPDFVSISLGGASADLEQGIAYQTFGYSTMVKIMQYPIELGIEGPEIGASSHVAIVDVNGYTAEYVLGGWESVGGKWVWKSIPYIQRLRWEQDGMFFEITVFSSYMISDMTMEDMIAVAESLH